MKKNMVFTSPAQQAWALVKAAGDVLSLIDFGDRDDLEDQAAELQNAIADYINSTPDG